METLHDKASIEKVLRLARDNGSAPLGSYLRAGSCEPTLLRVVYIERKYAVREYRNVGADGFKHVEETNTLYEDTKARVAAFIVEIKATKW